VCDITANVSELSSSDEQWVSSPIECMDKAVDRRPRIIVIRFGRMSIRERETLVELCGALKRNSHTRTCRLLALLRSKHRKLLEGLNRAGVDFARYVEDVPLDSSEMSGIVDGLGPRDRVERHLKVVCPFLHYSEIDSRHEMAVCGAYLDRMALGPSRLHELCETKDHLQCEYYKKPRPGS